MAPLNEKMQAALNKQIGAEMYSSYLYLSMCAYFEDKNLPGFANWMRVQNQEEAAHVDKFFDFVHERGGRVRLGAIEQPPTDWDTPLDVFKATYDHEQKVTALVDDLVALAVELRDRATESFLQWFVDEQVEEEASVDKIVKMLEMTDGSPVAMLMLDRELAQRTYVPPTPPA